MGLRLGGMAVPDGLSWRYPTTMLWYFLVAIQPAAWAVLALWLLKSLKQLKPRTMLCEPSIWLRTVVLLAVFWRFLQEHSSFPPNSKFPLEQQRNVINTFSSLGFLIMLAAMWGMWMVQTLVARQGRAPAASTEAGLKQYLDWRCQLDDLLFIAGVVVTLATVATAVLQPAVAELSSTPKTEGLAIVILYGAFASSLLIGAFLPADVALMREGRRLRDAMTGPWDTKAGFDWNGYVERLQALNTFLHLDRSAFDRVKIGIGVLSPTLGAIVSFYLGGK